MAGWVGRLEPGQTLDARPHFHGPWRDFRRVIVEASEEIVFEASDCEYAIFVMSGTGEATIGAQARPLTPGSALTVGYRARLQATAGDGPVELFVTTLDVRL
jgi:quercetin dioxygenase-like cupin family protein